MKFCLWQQPRATLPLSQSTYAARLKEHTEKQDGNGLFAKQCRQLDLDIPADYNRWLHDSLVFTYAE